MDKIIAMREELKDSTIGIVGLGHLGASLAQPLLDSGFSRRRLMISCRGSERTLARARAQGLEGCLADTETLMSNSDIIFVACRPQDLLTLPGDAVKEGAVVVSCMAGLPLSLLTRFFSGTVVRMMCSGPDSIADGLGIAVTYPRERRAETAIGLMDIELLEVGFEEELDSFTVGICIPPILLNVSLADAEISDALSRMWQRFPVYGLLTGWIDRVRAHASGENGERLSNVMTKGGISEAMYGCLKSGGAFAEALERGLARGREITAEIKRGVVITSVLPATETKERAG